MRTTFTAVATAVLALAVHLSSLAGFTSSRDQGYTWGRYRIIAGDWNRVEHASDIVVLDDETLVVPTIPRGDSEGRHQEYLTGVPVTVSYDGGNTWSADYRLRVGVDTGKTGGFPSSVVLPDQTIVTVWGRSGPLFATRWKLPPQAWKMA